MAGNAGTPDFSKWEFVLVHGTFGRDSPWTKETSLLRERVKEALGAVGHRDDLLPADVAVQFWLMNPRLLENLHKCDEIARPRSFRYFPAVRVGAGGGTRTHTDNPCLDIPSFPSIQFPGVPFSPPIPEFF